MDGFKQSSCGILRAFLSDPSMSWSGYPLALNLDLKVCDCARKSLSVVQFLLSLLNWPKGIFLRVLLSGRAEMTIRSKDSCQPYPWFISTHFFPSDIPLPPPLRNKLIPCSPALTARSFSPGHSIPTSGFFFPTFYFPIQGPPPKTILAPEWLFSRTDSDITNPPYGIFSAHHLQSIAG